MKPIKDFLPNIAISTPSSTTTPQWKFKLMQQWSSIMGNLVSKVSIHKIYGSSITLGVTDSGWMQELYMMSNLIKQKINTALDKPRIETIRFKYVSEKAKLPDLKTKAIGNEQASLDLTSQDLTSRDLTSREKSALAKINDPELLIALTRLLKKCPQ
jgi:hypothetical protein